IMKRFRRAVLAAACSGRLTEGWRERHPQVEPAVVTIERMRASTTETPWYEPVFEHRRKSEIPSSWSFVALGSLGSWYSGGTPSTSVSTFWTGGTVPWVTPKDMKTAIIMDSKDHITEDAVSKTRLHVLQPGSVMFVVRGLILARSFPVALAGRPTTINQDIRAIEARGGMSADYLLRALWAEEGEILHAVRDSTHGTKRLESDTLKSWPIPMPPPPEQDEIVRRVEALFALADAIEKHVAAAKLRADKLTQSILAKAFRGELVPTEAELARREGRSYEPASVLLGRIRAEREKGKPRTARSRKRGSAGPSVSSR
ncbi:MAG: restriction endonuclease subunit S, partial [Dehalococcoidia bacterium]|nr:restriction endonuclease subunit S [Dehalococcoidia bacterium]